MRGYWGLLGSCWEDLLGATMRSNREGLPQELPGYWQATSAHQNFALAPA
jgi:hypothetical protein